MNASQTPSARIRKSVKELYPTEEPPVVQQPPPSSASDIEAEVKVEGSTFANVAGQGSTTKTISGKTTRQSIPSASKMKGRPSMAKEVGYGVLGDQPQEKKKSIGPSFGTSTKGQNTKQRKDLGMFCTQQIQIPPLLPGILKAFAKAAIRTQPDNLLEWSISYFNCMANGEIPPVKDRLEFMPDSATEGLTVGLLQVLHKQLKDKEYVTFQELREKWRGICMKEKYLVKTWKKGKLDKHLPMEWKHVISLLCTLQGRNMNETMDAVCQVLSLQPVGGEPFLEWDEFWGIYVTLAQIDGRILQTTVEEVRDYLKPIALANHGLIGPRDFKNQNAPSLF